MKSSAIAPRESYASPRVRVNFVRRYFLMQQQDWPSKNFQPESVHFGGDLEGRYAAMEKSDVNRSG
jgi:hypothetical protein